MDLRRPVFIAHISSKWKMFTVQYISHMCVSLSLCVCIAFELAFDALATESIRKTNTHQHSVSLCLAMLVIYLFSCILCVPLCSIERISLAIVHKHSNINSSTHTQHSAAAVLLRISSLALFCFGYFVFFLFLLFIAVASPSLLPDDVAVCYYMIERALRSNCGKSGFSLQQFSIGIDCSFGFCNWLFLVSKEKNQPRWVRVCNEAHPTVPAVP